MDVVWSEDTKRASKRRLFASLGVAVTSDTMQLSVRPTDPIPATPMTVSTAQSDSDGSCDDRPTSVSASTSGHKIDLFDGTPSPHAVQMLPSLLGIVEPFHKCAYCGFAVDPLSKGLRVTKKSPMTFQCGKCNSKMVGCHRIFGQWPIAEFDGISAEAKQAFYGAAGAPLKESVLDSLVKWRCDEHVAEVCGKFLPLSVWERKGYDAEFIRTHTNAADIEWSPQVGNTYRVRVKTTIDRSIERSIREQIIEKYPRLCKYSRRGDPCVGAIKSIDVAPVTASDVASSGIRAIANNAGSCAPAEGSAVTRGAVKDVEKDRKRLRTMTVSLATKAVAKLEPLITAMSAAATDPKVSVCPLHLLSPVQSCLDKAQTMKRDATSALTDPTVLHMNFETADLVRLAADSTSHVKNLNGIIAALNKCA
jgi:hypothetical protein